MDFIEKVKAIGQKVETWQERVETEEATKNALVLPFIQALGYDIFNPEEVLPEFTADIGQKKGEKVDYAIMMNELPTILIECKTVSDPLNDHDSQLARYFHVTDAKFGVLTNGRIYKFFTDIDKPNRMDGRPFFIFDMLSSEEADIEELKKFRKSYFNLNEILSAASELKYAGEVRRIMSAELAEPSDELVKFFAKQFYHGNMSQKRVDGFRPIIKNAMNQYINELMSQRVSSALSRQSEESVDQEVDSEAAGQTEIEADEKQIVTTEEEIAGFHIIRGLLADVIQRDRVIYQDNKTYFSVYLDHTNQLLCRLWFNSPTKYVGIIDDKRNEQRYPIEEVDEIFKLEDQLKTAVQTLESKQ